MATTVARLEAVLSANTRDFDRGMQKSEGRMGRVGKAAGVAGLAIAGGLAVGLKKSFDAAMDAERAQTRLNTAFKAAKVPIKAHTKEIENASKRAIKLGFDDEDLKDTLGSLIIATGSYKKSQADANVAMDIARFKGISLEAATKMLTMAMAGSQRASKQLGLSVQAVTDEQAKAKHAFDANKDAINRQFDALGKLTPAQEAAKTAALDHAKAQYEGAKATAQVMDKQVTAGKVIDLVKEKVKGQAQAYSETAAGGIARFHASLEELEEGIGAALLPAFSRIITKLASMLEWLQKHPKALKAMTIALGALAAAMLTAAAAQAALNLAVLANPYVAATIAVIALAAGVFLLYTRVKQLRPVLELMAETFIGLPLPLRILITATGGLAKNFERLETVLGKVKDLIQWIIDHGKKLGGILGAIGSAAGAVNPFGDADPNKFKNFLGGMGTGPKSISPRLYDELSGAKAMGLVLTSGYRPGATTKHGTKSDHSYYPSRAIDVAGAPSQMARFFNWLIGQTDVKQAFYDPLGSIFGGVLNSYREGGHSDHVHVATYDQGGYLRPGWNLAYNGLGRPEPVGAGTQNFYFPNYVGSKSELLGWLQNAAQQFRRANGRGPF